MSMRTSLKRVVIALSTVSVLALTAATDAAAQGPANIVGTVTSEGGLPVSGALIAIPSLRQSTTSNDAGQFRMQVAAERVVSRTDTLVVTRIGYRPARTLFALASGTITVNVQLTTAAVALEQVLVTGTLGDQRQRVQSAVVAQIDAASITDK